MAPKDYNKDIKINPKTVHKAPLHHRFHKLSDKMTGANGPSVWTWVILGIGIVAVIIVFLL